MSKQLIYTSAPRGLKPGSSGFCTVAADGGMSQTLMTKLELLSGYEFRYNLSDPNAERNPINFCHTRITLGGRAASVLSRVGFCGSDYSSRTNKIAHHFLLEQGERLPGGPAWMMREMARGGRFRTAWNDPPKALASVALPDLLPRSAPDRQPLQEWSQLGDPGWAGLMAKAFCRSRKAPAYVIFEPGTDMLALFEESLRLLPANMRWGVHFATYYTSAPPDCHYHWRGILAGSSVLKEVARFPGATVIDLTKPLGRVPSAEDDEFTAAARAGRVVSTPRPKSVARVAQVAGGPIPLQPDDDEQDSRGGAAMAGLASAARTAPRSAAPPPHFVTVEKPPRWMKWTLSVLALLVCALVVSNATTLWLLHRSRQNGDGPSTDSTSPVTAPESVESQVAKAPAESDTKTPRATPSGAANKQPRKDTTSQSSTDGPSTEAQTSQPATTAAAVQTPSGPNYTECKLSPGTGRASPGAVNAWPEQGWKEGRPVEVPVRIESGPDERWELLDLPSRVVQKGIRSYAVRGHAVVGLSGGLSPQVLVRGVLKRSVDRKKLLLKCTADKAAWADPKLGLMIQWLVVQIRARDAQTTVRFALRKEGPLEWKARCGWINGKVTLLKSLQPQPSYPWPKVLRIGLRGRGPSDSVELHMNDKKVKVSIVVAPQGDKSSIALSSVYLDKRFAQWDKGLADNKTELQERENTVRTRQEEHDRANGQDKEITRGRLKEAREALGKAENEIQRIVDKIKALAAQLEKAGPIVVYDPWDLPVAEVRIELVPPGKQGEPGGAE